MLEFLNPDDILFYISKGNLICLRYRGEDYGRVAVLLAFPYKMSDEYIVIRKEDYSRLDSENEIGIIKNLNDLQSEQIKIVKEELNKRYFMPEVTKINEIKEEFGNIFLAVDTNAGIREFTVTDLSSNIRKTDGGKILLTDIYGNRYLIKSIDVIDKKSMKILEIWI